MIVRHEVIAEKYLRGVYSGDTSVVDDLAGNDVIATYPIFNKIFNTPSLIGREAVKKLATGFASRWKNPQITIHETVKQDNKVVFIWSFRAKRIDSTAEDNKTTDEVHSWGGITFFRFDESGKIIVEIGEESEPGPIGRLT